MTDAARLAGLVASRICHDLISPVGAVGNGLELMRGQGDGDALALAEESAAAAADALRFLRLAFGAREAGDHVGQAELEATARGHFSRRRVALDWRAAPAVLPARAAGPLLLLALAGAAAAPRGGLLVLARAEVEPLALEWRVEAESLRPPPPLPHRPPGPISDRATPRDAHLILLARLAAAEGARIYWEEPNRIGLG